MTRPDMSDLSDVFRAPLALVVAALARTPRRGALLQGPPGCGATMIARRVPGILPEPTDHEIRWIQIEQEGAGRPGVRALARPFRAPHHTVSSAGLVGLVRGGSRRAGEVHLARFGVLFLDELPEFSLSALSALRAALVRMGTTAPLIIASAPECPCGWAGSDSPRTCACSDAARDRYAERVQRAMEQLDLTRIDLPYVSVASVQHAAPGGESSASIQARLALPRCPVCGDPAHASESDDTDTHAECQAHEGAAVNSAALSILEQGAAIEVVDYGARTPPAPGSWARILHDNITRRKGEN